MLDERLTYTCGYWKHAKDLNTAQVDKLDLI
jgi:cyclopropane-fatty-acyl-phospholipid synthase